jgi:hyperosmotically inducible periplasmic protein
LAGIRAEIMVKMQAVGGVVRVLGARLRRKMILFRRPSPIQGKERLVNLKRGIRTFLLVSSLLGGTWVIAQDSTAVPADNTKVNQRDQNASEPTADQQKNKTSDRDMTQQIRKAIMKDKSLSTYAHNVKIITQNGQVTLKGPVQSDDEKRVVEAKAAEVAGQNNVTSQLDVEAKK